MLAASCATWHAANRARRRGSMPQNAKKGCLRLLPSVWWLKSAPRYSMTARSTLRPPPVGTEAVDSRPMTRVHIVDAWRFDGVPRRSFGGRVEARQGTASWRYLESGWTEIDERW